MPLSQAQRAGAKEPARARLLERIQQRNTPTSHALLVAANIVVTGVSLVRRFTGGLMDRALPPCLLCGHGAGPPAGDPAHRA